MSSTTPDILLADLSTGTLRRCAVSPESRSLFVGGRGLAGASLDAAAHLSWDDPEAAICFFPGRLAGIGLPGAGHLSVAFLSPRTGGVSHVSVGGRLGDALTRAGLAGVVLTGRATRPLGLAIVDNVAELVDAGPLWGLPTDALFAALGAYDGVAAIGPAAVAGSPLASLVVDRWHMGGRGGLGLALAAKNCLFLAATGHVAPPVADPDGLLRARAAMERLIAASPALAGDCGFGRYGTAALVDLTNGRRMMPTRNFRQTFFLQAPTVNAPRLGATFDALAVACPGCPIGCRRVTRDGRLLPDVDALSHFTALLGLPDARMAVFGNDLCLRAGLDPVAAAATLACHVEISGETPSPARLLELVAGMATMEGLGRELSQGAFSYAASRGRPEVAMHAKGLELPAFDPRGAYGLALSLAVLPGGPDPWGAGCLAHELLRKPVVTDRFTFDGKARAVFLGENAVAAADCLGGCPWQGLAVTLEEWGLALAAVTGEPVSAGDLSRIGERTALLERVQNARRGFTSHEDTLPERFFSDPGSSGDGIEVPPLPREAFLTARGKYYRLRGLDAEGRPTAARAAQLEVPWTR